MKEIKFESIMEVLDNFGAKERLADAAIEWRRALIGGHWDKAAEKLAILIRVTDEYILAQPEETWDREEETPS